VTIDGNHIVNNRSFRSTMEGGIHLEMAHDDMTGFVNIQNNIIAFNEGYTAGGIFFSKSANSRVSVLNNTIYGNTGGYRGGLYMGGPYATIANNIVYQNTATYNPGQDDISPPDPYLNGVQVISNIIGDGQFNGVNGNLSNDPLLIDPTNSNFHLKSNSPAIDTGANVSLGYDVEDHIRPMDGDGSGNSEWDRGADEYFPPFTPTSFIYLPVIDSHLQGCVS
jgi:hypothetical protein